MSNYYELLGCTRQASLDQLKKGYREGAKKFHPDKSREETRIDFEKLRKAWETLSDREKRKEYDRELAKRELEASPIYAEVDLAEMTRESDGSSYTYSCRCGGMYALEKRDLVDAEEVRVCCDDCTFHLRVRVAGGNTT